MVENKRAINARGSQVRYALMRACVIALRKVVFGCFVVTATQRLRLGDTLQQGIDPDVCIQTVANIAFFLQ